MNIGYTVRLPEEQIKLFNRKYPGLLSKLMQSSLELSLKDEKIFQSILFKTLEVN